MKRFLLPLRFLADCINWLIEEAWYRYVNLTKGYWKRIGLVGQNPFALKTDKLKVSISDILSFPIFVLFFLGFVVLAVLFGWFVFVHPFIFFEKLLNFIGNWVGIFAVIGFVGWIGYVSERPKKWPWLPWEKETKLISKK